MNPDPIQQMCEARQRIKVWFDFDKRQPEMICPGSDCYVLRGIGPE